jgi:MFS family permease
MSDVRNAGPTAVAEDPGGNGRAGAGAVSTAAEEERAGKQRGRSYYAEILLISFAALLLEISYTRVISFKLFYYYTYLVIGLALLGLGSGAVFVALSGRLKRASTDTILIWGSLLGAVSVGVGYLVVSLTPIATLEIWDYWSADSFLNLGRLVVVCLALFASFVAIGIMIATLFGREADRIGRLYFADLVGAGIACAVVVSLLQWIGPVSTIFLAGVVLALTGASLALRERERPSRKAPMAAVGAVLAALLGIVAVAPDVLPDLKADEVKADLNDDNTMYSSWSPIFRVDAEDAGDVRLLYHDGLLGSAIYRFNGDVSTLGRFETDPRSLPFAVVGEDPRNAMIIGAAGGHEILSSLYYDVGQIDAIELNPVTYDLVKDRFADYSGHLADNPRVNYVNGDGRSFLARSDDDYDLIWYPAPDSYSAANASTAGAFVLSESYLYTSDTIEESLEHLSEDGIIAAQFGEVNFEDKPNRTTRYVSTARHALEEMGVEDPSQHVLVATSPTDLGASSVATILVKRQPFTPEEVQAFTTQLGDVDDGVLRYAPDGDFEPSAVSEVASIPEADLDGWYDDYEYDVRPITDDGPFFWHFTRFGDVISGYGDDIDRLDHEDATGERVLLLLLGVAILFALVFLLLPFLAIRTTWARLPRKPRSALYFACLGLGFMFFEITLIQRLTLFLGYPTYSLTVTLASILIFTGVGALLSGRVKDRTRQVVPALLGAIAVLTVFYLFGLPALTDALLGWPLLARVLVAFVVLAPLGICLGMFMPLGIGAVASLTPYQSEYVAWGWAVNGFASVIGSVLTTILAMAFGFQAVLVLGLAVYVVALLTLRTLVGSGGTARAAA